MDEREGRRQEMMRDLAARFKNSSEVMKLIARRIGEAARRHNANHRRLERALGPLRQAIDPELSAVPFTYREFIEFSSADEFRRFRAQAPVSDHDLENIDWDALFRGLLEE